MVQVFYNYNLQSSWSEKQGAVLEIISQCCGRGVSWLLYIQWCNIQGMDLSQMIYHFFFRLATSFIISSLNAVPNFTKSKPALEVVAWCALADCSFRTSAPFFNISSPDFVTTAWLVVRNESIFKATCWNVLFRASAPTRCSFANHWKIFPKKPAMILYNCFSSDVYASKK